MEKAPYRQLGVLGGLLALDRSESASSSYVQPTRIIRNNYGS